MTTQADIAVLTDDGRLQIHDVDAWIAQHEDLADRCLERYALQHPFMVDLKKGTLPLTAIQSYMRNFYTFALEVNTATGTLYHRFNPVTRRIPEIEDILTDKISDEFGSPGPGGHIRTFESTAAKLGLTRDECVNQKLSPNARGYTDFKVRQIFEGTIGEYSISGITEGRWGVWSRHFQGGLSAHYVAEQEATPFFATHAEADTAQHGEHEGHGQLARRLIELLVEHDEYRFRPGMSPEYLIVMTFYLHSKMLDDAYSGVTYESLIP